MGYLFLAIAIITEVIGTIALKYATEGNNRVLAYIIVAVGYIAAFFMLSQSLTRGVPLGIAYAIWAGVGVVLVVVLSWVMFKESLTWIQVAGMVLVIGGVTLLELGGAKQP